MQKPAVTWTDGCDTHKHTHSHTHFHSPWLKHNHKESVTHTLLFYRGTELYKSAERLFSLRPNKRQQGLEARPVSGGGGGRGREKMGVNNTSLPAPPQTRLVHHMAWLVVVVGVWVLLCAVERALHCSQTLGTWNMARCCRQAYKLFTAADQMSFKLLNMHQQTRA